MPAGNVEDQMSTQVLLPYRLSDSACHLSFALNVCATSLFDWLFVALTTCGNGIAFVLCTWVHLVLLLSAVCSLGSLY